MVNANREEHVVAPQATVWVPGKDRVYQDGIHLINLDREEKLKSLQSSIEAKLKGPKIYQDGIHLMREGIY